eukprot:9714889-Prorocentrum_lima.AAC.1
MSSSLVFSASAASKVLLRSLSPVSSTCAFKFASCRLLSRSAAIIFSSCSALALEMVLTRASSSSPVAAILQLKFGNAGVDVQVKKKKRSESDQCQGPTVSKGTFLRKGPDAS